MWEFQILFKYQHVWLFQTLGWTTTWSERMSQASLWTQTRHSLTLTVQSLLLCGTTVSDNVTLAFSDLLVLGLWELSIKYQTQNQNHTESGSEGRECYISPFLSTGKRHEPHVESNNMSVVEATLYKAYRVLWLYKFGKCEASLGRCPGEWCRYSNLLPVLASWDIKSSAIRLPCGCGVRMCSSNYRHAAVISPQGSRKDTALMLPLCLN